MRLNPSSGNSEGYYRLVESYRNETNRVCHRTILNIGFIGKQLQPEQMNIIQKQLTLRAKGQQDIFFNSEDPLVIKYIEELWNEMISKKRVDLPENKKAKQKGMIYTETVKHKDAREIGAEWLSYQAIEQLKIREQLMTMGWEDQRIRLALTQIISRAVYPASELETTRWIKENSAVCEITGCDITKITKDKLYKSALDLYSIKDQLEHHLSKRTNDLFDLQDKIILYDLTNTYFEGAKKNSTLSKFGRSKEKRNDAKIVVLAVVINLEGFIKYSNIFEGNMSDARSLPRIIHHLNQKLHNQNEKPIIVIDAGIASAENLDMLIKENYNYVCVSRSKLKDYTIAPKDITQKIYTKNQEELTVQRVYSNKTTDYYLKVKSPGKALKETSMKNQFEARFEQELIKIQNSLSLKHTVKKMEKVSIRLGRAIQKYPSVSKYYNTELITNKKGLAIKLLWEKDNDEYTQVINNLGVYFLQTNMAIESENMLWEIYNTIREIEYTFRTLKTDLDLRPIYHKKDNATMAHLHLGILAYWVVNTIRYQLKQQNENHCWKEIVRVCNTQKLVTTAASNDFETYTIKRCTEPNNTIIEIYRKLGYKNFPFTKIKSVVHKPEFQKNETHINTQNST